MAFRLTFLLALFSGLLGAQVILRLQVNDPSGTGMTVAGRINGSLRLATAPDGSWTSPSLAKGRYRVDLVKAGFAPQHFELDLQQDTLRTVTMPLAQAPSTHVDVIETAPLTGMELEAEQIAAPVQTANQKDLEKSGALELTAFLRDRINGISLNEMQGNPYQSDVSYRGYMASPLLGTPQGLSVYLDGVRMNEAFGDVVSWDLIPRNAIAELTLMPGSNPVFGLNTLGGALALQTKTGSTNPGFAGGLTYGSSGRKAIAGELGGGKADGLDWFAAGNIFHESGWRVRSPSDVKQGFVSSGLHRARTDYSLGVSYAYNNLTGNGLQEQRFLVKDWSSVYTTPDITKDRSPLVRFSVRHSFSPTLSFSANAYYRNIRTEQVNGNLNTDSLDQSVYQPSAADIVALKAAGYTGYPASGANAANTPFPYWRCIAQALQFASPSNRCSGLIAYTKGLQNQFGGSGQLSWIRGGNHLTAGAGFYGSFVDFTQTQQFGYLNPDRSITGIASWADGSTTSDGEPLDNRVNLHGLNRTWSLYVMDSFKLGKWNFTAAGRFNRNLLQNTDQLGTSLNGRLQVQRLNPALGVTYSPWSNINIYGGYTQGSRAPTSIELGCADPNHPCNLPNALAGDPPLHQVVTVTWEAGARGTIAGGARWNTGAFRSENRNDILFVASSQTGFGYFKSFGLTRRQGVESGLSKSWEGILQGLTAGVKHTYLAATYQSQDLVNGSGNSSNDAGLPGLSGNITILPGNRIPLIPKQNGKAYLDLQVTRKFSLNADFVAVSSSYARGNENNSHRPDGKYYLGPGVSPGYAVLDFHAAYQVSRHWKFSVQLDNAFDRRYYSAAQLGPTGFTDGGAFIARPFPAYKTGDYPIQHATFYAPGAPRRCWMELKLTY